MRKIALIVIFIIFSAGCLGEQKYTSIITVTETVKETVTKTTTETMRETTTETVTKTMTETFTPIEKLEQLNSTIKELNQTVIRLNQSLISCLLTLSSQNETIKDQKEKINQLESAYLSCLLQKSAQQNSEFKVLFGREYYYEVLKTIEEANESIHIAMFLMKYDAGDSFDWANDLIRALVRAKKRGLEVYVVLENSVEINQAAHSYLRANGIEVRFDSPDRTLHAKIVVIDGKVAFIGSHNWSESGLYWNNEVSVEIKSKEVAQEVISYITSIQ